MGFYEEIADEYDEMMDFERRLSAATSFSREISQRYHAAAACDVACGTGLYALALAQAGLGRVAGSDLSERMLNVARKRAQQYQADIEWIRCDMQHSGECLSGPYDLILCLGNSIPHLLTQAAFGRTLDGFRSQLQPGGRCIVQVLNYDKILREQDRIVDITRSEDTNSEFVRFYDFLERTVRFNLLTVHWHKRKARHSIQSTELYPYKAEELTDSFENHGFGSFEFYGGPDFSSYNPDASASLLLIAERI